MSIWIEFKGKTSSKKVSIKKVCDLIIKHEYTLKLKKDGFYISFTGYDLESIKLVDDFARAIKEFDNKCSVEITITHARIFK